MTRPVAGTPSIEDLKQRDHRKIVVVDGRLALVGGRNLSHEYYAGFDEVALGPASLWRDVPWLDAGARVEGPAVEALERSFLDAWTTAGGAPFDVAPQEPAGGAAARVVVHHGLRDAPTLDTYLALIDAARTERLGRERFPARPRDPARAPPRDRPGRHGSRDRRPHDADARGDPVPRALEHGAAGGERARRLAPRRPRRGRGRGVPARGPRAAGLGGGARHRAPARARQGRERGRPRLLRRERQPRRHGRLLGGRAPARRGGRERRRLARVAARGDRRGLRADRAR